MIRIRRTETSGYVDFDATWPETAYERLHKIARRHLPPTTLSIFSKPVVTNNGENVDWLAEVGGQPEPIANQNEETATNARALINERLLSILKLADSLDASSPNDAAFLRSLAKYPDDSSILVLNGQPVLTEWGFHTVGNEPMIPSASGAIPVRAVPAGAALLDETPKRNGRAWLWWLLAFLLIAAIAAFLWWWFNRDSGDDIFERVAAANCEQASALLDEPVFRAPVDEAYVELLSQLNTKVDDCQYEALREKVRAAEGECRRLADVSDDSYLRSSDTDRVVELRTAVDRGLLDCRYLEMREVVNGGECPAIQELISTADEFQTPPEPRFAALRESANVVLSDCRYDEIAENVRRADGQCEPMRALLAAEALLQTPPEPRYERLRSDVDRTIEDCLYDELVEQVDEASCDELSVLLNENERLASEEQRYVDLRTTAEEKASECALDELQEKVDEALEDCETSKAMLANEELQNATNPRAIAMKAALEERIEQCRPPEDLCPDERKPEDAPEFVLVLDASGSMDDPIGVDAATQARWAQMIRNNGFVGIAQVNQERAQLQTRMDIAKQSVRSVVSALPNDVSTGFVLVESCPRARRVGFFSPAQRSQLLSRVMGVQPVGGTPLADGVWQAAQMIDGVNKPAVMVVVSDGEDTCQGNVRQVANAIARAKPKLTINVVDIDGAGAGVDLARATGGEVLTARSAAEVTRNVERAAAQALGPARCRSN